VKSKYPKKPDLEGVVILSNITTTSEKSKNMDEFQ